MKTALPILLLGLLAGSVESADQDDQLPPPPAGKTWKLVWQDEFDGDQARRRRSGKCRIDKRRDGWWSPKAVALDGKGNLVISTLKDGDRYLDGCMRTQGKFEHAFGYYVARIKLQKQPGHWSAFWITTPASARSATTAGTGPRSTSWRSRGWTTGFSTRSTGTATARTTSPRARSPTCRASWRAGTPSALWWKPDEYVFYVDGKETWRTKAGGVCQVPAVHHAERRNRQLGRRHRQGEAARPVPGGLRAGVRLGGCQVNPQPTKENP